ncbi:hypothetical protein J7E93_00855 [Streptomyces sp. ISL-36]|uniref:hypothetical protein n=1 Tax=Streptomyces sp. ISL-36 TaxID=2819182 RepID=UPI001BEA7F33|nr:hypothetical protein [Streptomyces sp. ISL-36]MBT2438697.1 hypothetical protein [Streptomyces sp. ISL-36]
MTHVRAASAGLLSALALVALGSVPARAADAPPAASPEQAASAPATLDTLSRFFSRDGAVARAAAAPRVEGPSVPVRILSPDFVAGKAGAPVARVEFHASKAVASDGQTASLWTVRQGGGWQVVNIATGDDEIRYAAQGARTLPGGVVFREPQIDAWYVHKGAKVLPLDEDAVRAVGRNGTSLAAYRERVVRAYGDKLPGSGYARKGTAGGYDTPAAAPEEPLVTAASATAGVGAALALGLFGTAVWRRRRTAARQEAAS